MTGNFFFDPDFTLTICQDDKLMLEFSPGNTRNADVEYDVKQIKGTYSTYQILKGIKYNIHTEDNKP